MSIALLATCAAAQEAGWPQWGGPARDFRLPAAALAEQWPAGGPPERWTRPVGGGHGGIAVVGGELYTLVRRGDREIDVALDAATGDTVWQRHDFGLDYASPIVIERDGMTELVCQFENELVGLRLSDGELAWRLPSDGERTRHVITPLDLGGALLASTTHAARRVEIGANGATGEWRNRRLRPQVGNVVHARHCGLVLGASSPFTGALIVALDAETGERRWRSRDIDAGFLWLVGDEVFGLSRDGELVQARCDRDGLTVRNRCRPFTGDKIWSAPAMVGARLYFKGDGRIRALDLSR